MRLPPPRRGDVRRETVVGAIEPALGEVPVADRLAGDGAGEAERERLIDRRRDRAGAHPPVPASQPLDRGSLALVTGTEAGEPVDGLEPGDRQQIGLNRPEAVEI